MSLATTRMRAVLLLALCALTAVAAAAEQSPEEMLDNLHDAISIPESIELEGNPVASSEGADEIQSEDEGVDEIATKALSEKAKKRIADRVLKSGCRESICVGTSTIDLTFVVDGKNFNLWRPFIAKLVNRLRVARYNVRINTIVAGQTPHMLFDFDNKKPSIVSKVLKTTYAPKETARVALGEALHHYRKHVLKRGRRFSGKLIVVLTSMDSNFGRSVVDEASYLANHGVTFLPVMVGYEVSQDFWKKRATGGKYVWVKNFSDLQFVVDAFVHMRISWKLKLKLMNVLKCPKAVRYTTPCKNGFRETLEIGFVKVFNKCNPVNKVVRRKECGCEKGECFASQAMELILVMQASADIGETFFGYEKEFVISMIQKMKIGAKSVRVAVVLFADSASLGFRLTQYTSSEGVISAIKAFKLLKGDHNAIGDALLIVREQILVESHYKSAKMLIVITDGQSDYGRSVEIEAASLREKSVSILVIGVGPKATMASLEVISKICIRITTWLKLRVAAKYVLRMRISFAARPAVHGELKIRCPKYKRVLVTKCIGGFKTRTVRFYKEAENTCLLQRLVKKVACEKTPKCVEGTKVRVGKCDFKKKFRIVTKVHTSKTRDCTRKPCVMRCSRRLVNVHVHCHKVRCVKRKLTIEKHCSKSGERQIYWGFYSSIDGNCRRIRTQVVRKIPCGGCVKRQISFFHISIGKKCVGGQKALYAYLFASHKGKCSYRQVEISKRRCILTKRCKQRARIQVDTGCLRKGSRFRGIYWTYRTRLEANGPCVRVRGRLIGLTPCGSCTRAQRSFSQVTMGKKCESGFITSHVTIFQGEESRACHKARILIQKRTCLSCGKPKLETTPCISGFKRTYNISYTAVNAKCVSQKALVKSEKCGKSNGCPESSQIKTKCSKTSKFSFITTYYFEPQKQCTGLVLPAPIKRVCNQVADLVFLLDSSTSIQTDDFVKESLFVQHIVQNMDVSSTGIRVAVLTFASHPNLVFNLDTYSAKSKIIDVMKALPRVEGATLTNAAIDLVDSDIFPKRRAGVPFVIVVITDGQSTLSSETIASAEALKKKGARFVSVGIYNTDPEVKDKINPDELKAISSTGTYYRADDFNKLNSIVNNVTRQVCKDMGETDTVRPTKSVCKTVCVKKTKESDRKPCISVDCRTKTLVRPCKKDRAFRYLVKLTYAFNGKKCVIKTRKVIKKLACPPKPCPKGQTVRTYCKPGVKASTKTIIFYVSTVRCTKSLPPHCTQSCLKKVARSSKPCRATKCKRNSVSATKCGGNLRFRTVVNTSYARVGTVCKKTVKTLTFPCPVRCPKTHTEIIPCTKGAKFEVKSIISYSVRRSCVLNRNCKVQCVRRVVRERKSCTPPVVPRRCKNPLPIWTDCKKNTAYKYKVQYYYGDVKGVCVIVRRITRGRLLCPPKPCPKAQIIRNDCVKGAKHRITTNIFYTSKIVCSKRNPEVCQQTCQRQVTRSAVPCGTPIGCDTARRTSVTKCGGARRYRSIITTWNTLVGKVCKEHTLRKHFPCPVTCPKSKIEKRTRCSKGAKYRLVFTSTYTVKKTCVKDICTLACVKKILRSQVLCRVRIVCKKPHKKVTGCSNGNKFSFVTTISYERKRLCTRLVTGCKYICVKKRKVSNKRACNKPKPCPYEVSFKTSDCINDFRTVTAIYRSLIAGHCVLRSKTVRRIRCSGCSSYQKHFHAMTVGKNCTEGQTSSILIIYESRKYKNDWVCYQKRVKVSIIKCSCNKKPIILIDKECINGFRNETRVVFSSDRTGACVMSQKIAKQKCPPVKCFDRKVLRKCRKDYAFQYVIQILYKPVNGRCVSYKSKTLKKIPCPPKPCPKLKTIKKDCTKGAKMRVTISIFYTSKVVCSKKNPEVCKQTCHRQETRSAVPCIQPIGCDTTKRIKVTKCGAKRRYRSIITTWATRVGLTCKKHKLTKHLPCPVTCPKLKVIHVPCVGARKFRESRTITYTVKKSCLKSICVLRCVRNELVSRIPCSSPVVCAPRKRVLPCSKVSAFRTIVQINYKFTKGKCRVDSKKILEKIPCPCKTGNTEIKKCFKGYRQVVKTVYIRVGGVCRAKSVVLRRIGCDEPKRCSRNYYVVTTCFHGVRRLLYVTSKSVKSGGKFTCVSKTTVAAYFDCEPDCRYGVQKKLVLGCKCLRNKRNLYQITFTAKSSKCTHSVELMGHVSCTDCLSYLKRWKHWLLKLKVKKLVKPVLRPKNDRRPLL